MINYYKYLPVSREDENWGLCVLNTGCTHIEATGLYPFKTHPAHHYFNWSIGRILNEYQIIYITRGRGLFESDSCKCKEIEAGTIIILFPGERHRYKPDSDTGWDEYWIGLKGDIIDNLVKKNFLNSCWNNQLKINGESNAANSILVLSFSERTGSEIFHSIPSSGSFHISPCSEALL